MGDIDANLRGGESVCKEEAQEEVIVAKEIKQELCQFMQVPPQVSEQNECSTIESQEPLGEGGAVTQANAEQSPTMELNDFSEAVLQVVLEEILKNLPLEDLKAAVLVSRTWKKEGEHPDLWERCLVQVHNREEIKNLSLRRLRQIEELGVLPGDEWEDGDWNAFFKASLNLSRLKRISGLEGKPLFSVDPKIFGEALARLKIVDLRNTEITNDQAKELFTEMCRRQEMEKTKTKHEDQARCEKTGLKKLNLSNNDLSAIEPGLIGKALSRLEAVDLSNTSLTEDQVKEMFPQIAKDSQLKILYLDNNDLSTVEAELLAKVASRMEKVDLWGTELTEAQLQEMVTKIAQDSQLKDLNLSDNDLSTVDAELLAKVVSRMEVVNLRETDLTEDQVQEMFTQMSQNTRLEDLYLGANDLSSVDPGILANTVIRIKTVELYRTEITHDQQMALLTAICEGNDIKLKKLNLSETDMSILGSQLLSTAVHRLEVVDLRDTDLTQEQFHSILSGGNGQSKLKELSMWDPDNNENVVRYMQW